MGKRLCFIFIKAILKAVNLGEDTDTVAAITGSIAGMYKQLDEIPEEWLGKIVNKQKVDDLILAFYEFCTAQM